MICISSGFGFIVVGVNSSAGSEESRISIIKEGKYIPAAGVVLIISGKTDDTSSSRKKVIVIVVASSSEVKSSNEAATWLVSNLVVDTGFDSFFGSGDGSLSGWQRFIVGISRDREYTHKIDGVNNMHKIETHVSTVQ